MINFEFHEHLSKKTHSKMKKWLTRNVPYTDHIQWYIGINIDGKQGASFHDEQHAFLFKIAFSEHIK